MRRRAFALLACSLATSPRGTNAQSTRVPRIGFLASSSAERVAGRFAAFRHALAELGYREGSSVVIDQRYAGGNPGLLSSLAAELVRLPVDILVTEGTPAAVAAKKATDSIPVVFGNAGDPVATGLVASLAKPGGNVTGLSDFSASLVTKRLELLKEVAPATTSVAFLFNPRNPSNLLELSQLRAVAEAAKVKMVAIEIVEAGNIAPAATAVGDGKADALIVAGDPTLGVNQKDIIELARARRLPALYPARIYADAGGLISFGTNFDALFRRAALFVSKILQGTRPADLSVEQPIAFEVVINMRTARSLGLTVPAHVLIRADEVIE